MQGIALMALWTVEQLLWSPRTIAMGLLASSTILLTLAYRVLLAFGVSITTTGFGVFSIIAATLGFQFVSPMLALFYGGGVVSDDVESGAMPFFLTRPIPRHHFLAGKMLGSWAIQILLFVPPLVLSYYIALSPGGWDEVGRRFPALLADVGVALLGAAAYSGLFALLGTAFRRPLLIGLFFVFGWQAAAPYVPGLVQHLTIAYYLQSLVPHQGLSGPLARLLSSPTSPPIAVAALVGIAAVTHGLAMWIFGRKEI